MESGAGRWGIESRKTVTVLFCDVVAFTQLAEGLDPEALRGVMGQYFERAEAAVERHGGTVDKFIGDEVMATFGVPIVHEEDALRAVRAAAEMRETVVEVERGLGSGAHLQVRIGVNTGEVAVSDPSSGHSFLSGDAVAVAKRLEQAAEPGEILLGATTHALVAHAVEATPLEPLSLKGLSSSARAYRLESIDQEATAIARRHDTPVKGRGPELGQLRSLFADSAAGRSRFAVVLGEPGLGKSRLAHELASEVRDTSTVLVGRCPPYGEGVTFSPVREVFRSAGRDYELEGSSYEVFAATRTLVEELAAERPVLLVLDDIHWAEETLLDLIEHLGQRLTGRRVMLLCLARPELAERRAGWLRDPETALRLEPLSDRESEALIEALGVGDAVRRRIAELAEGNPLFMEQLAASAREAAASVEMAGSIRGVLHARLDRLGGGQRAVLERAAVCGRTFPVAAVLELAPPGEREQAGEHLFELARRGLIHPDASVEEESFRFQHALIREAVYDAMAKAARADLHEAVAAWLGAGGAPGAIVGYHLEHTFLLRRELGLMEPELGARAGRLLREAAEEAYNRADNPATISLLERARVLLPELDPTLPVVLTEIGYAKIIAGDMTNAGKALDDAIDAAVAIGDRAAELHARIERHFVDGFLGTRESAAESAVFAETALAELEHFDDELAFARALWLKSSADVQACRWHERALALDEALVHARRARVGLDVVGTLSGSLASALVHGPTPVGPAAERVAGLLEGVGGDRIAEAGIGANFATLLAMQDRIDEARDVYRTAAATLEEFGFRFRRAVQAFPGAQVELLAGNPEGAERELVVSARAMGEFGAQSSAATHRALLANVLCLLGRRAEAETLAREVAAVATEEDLVTKVLWRDALARALGEGDEAAVLIEEALRLTEGVEFPFLRVDALTAAVELGRVDAAQLLADALAIMEAKGNIPEVRRLERLSAPA